MDPITLFALANGAVSAVKAGCKLYRDIKGAAGEVKDREAAAGAVQGKNVIYNE